MSESEREFIDAKVRYAKRLTDYLSRYPTNFKDFAGNPEIISFGDEFLSRYMSRGYNFATDEQFPITSTESLIFYSVYAQRVEHFGQLLARMETEEVIRNEDVSFGIKASKILGDYSDPELTISWLKMRDGHMEKTLESIEAVAIFHPTWQGHALKILDFLLNIAPKIEGGYEDPDTRATPTKELRQIVSRSKILKIARANIFRFEEGNLIMLRQTTPFDDKGWKNYPSLVNPELYEYLTSAEVAA